MITVVGEALPSVVLRMFLAGQSTAEIATRHKWPELVVERLLHKAMDLRHGFVAPPISAG